MSDLFPGPPPGMIFPPSHVTRAQAARMINAAIAPKDSLSSVWIYKQFRVEKWYGTGMIPLFKVMAFIADRKGKQ